MSEEVEVWALCRRCGVKVARLVLSTDPNWEEDVRIFRASGAQLEVDGRTRDTLSGVQLAAQSVRGIEDRFVLTHAGSKRHPCGAVMPLRRDTLVARLRAIGPDDTSMGL